MADNFFTRIFKKTPPQTDKGKDDRPNIPSLPGGRKSEPTAGPRTIAADVARVTSQYGSITRNYIRQIIPVIRKLVKFNEDVGQVVDNIITLGNTGHKIFFDKNVPAPQVDAMRNHLVNKRKNWGPGNAGMHIIINKLFAQLLTSGAISGEWVVDNDLTGIKGVVLVNPENVEFFLQPDNLTYLPYQRVTHSTGTPYNKNIKNGLIALNPLTYQYFALNGDEESPEGFPPYLPVINRIVTQQNMHKNIDYIVDMMGLVGFMEALIQKPDELGNESIPDYQVRLTSLLDQAKAQLKTGMKEGLVVGFKDDHEFKFNSPASNYESVTTLFENNELQVASALKHDASLMGRGYSTTESQIGVVFMKMLSQLRNMQNIIGPFVEYGYALELRLAGFKFDYLSVKFNRSTLQDDYKYQQAEQLKVENVIKKLVAGLITQDDAADELGYEVPAFPEPKVSWDVLAGGTDPKPADTGTGKSARNTQKKKSDKKTRSSKKATPKTK